MPAHYYSAKVVAISDDHLMGIARTTNNTLIEEPELRIELAKTKAIVVSVQGEDGLPVVGAQVNITFDQPPDLPYIEIPSVETSAKGTATLRIPKSAQCRGICARSPNSRLAGLVETGPDATTVTVQIQPLGGIAGQLVDSGGKPLAKHPFYCGPVVRDNDESSPWMRCFSGHATTDKDGNFTLRNLVVGGRYRIIDGKAHQTVKMVTVDGASTIQLGKLEVRAPSPGHATDQRVTRVITDENGKKRGHTLNISGDASETYAQARRDAHSYRQRVALLLVDPKADATQELMELRGTSKDVRRALDNFRLVFVDATGEPAKALLKSLDVKLAASDAWPQIVVRDDQGAAVAEGERADISVGGKIDQSRLIDWLRANALEPLDAQKLLDDALADARKSKRRVLVQQTAVWCGPCHLLATYLEGQREIWEKDYIWIRLDERWTHSKEVVGGIRDPKSGGGIPWLAILDADGQVLSAITGYPGTPAGADEFLAMLKDNSTRLSDDDLAKLRAPLAKK